MTHQRQHLPGCDRVIVLSGGRVVADGSFAQLSAAGGFSAELGGGCGEAAAELDDAAYDEGIAAAEAGSGASAAEGTPSDRNAAEAQATSGGLAATGTPPNGMAPAPRLEDSHISSGTCAEEASSNGALAGQVQGQDELERKAGGQEKNSCNTAAGGHAAGRAQVPASVFGVTNSGDGAKSVGWSQGEAEGDAGVRKGEQTSRFSSRLSGLQTAASRMRRDLSRCTL